MKVVLGDDCISRQAVIDMTGLSEWFDSSDSYNEFVIALSELPSVTPIRPKGHWILTDVEGNRVWFCNCSECGKDPQDYISGTENWWLTKSNLPNYCPNCGSDNKEVEE